MEITGVKEDSAKYNRLMEIEKELSTAALYKGRGALYNVRA
jgi:enolase